MSLVGLMAGEWRVRMLEDVAHNRVALNMSSFVFVRDVGGPSVA